MSRKHTLVGTLSVALAGAAIFGVGLSACDHACTSCDHDEPAAAYDLTAEIGEGGVLLTWEDASEIEDSYVVQRRDEDEDHFRELARLDEDAVEYLDADVKAGTTYVYRIEAVNDAGSSISDEIEVMVP